MDEATEGLLHELAIRRVLEHYMRANDDRRLDDLIELFEPEAVFRMRGDTYRGRDEIRSFFESGPDRSAQPRWHEPDQRLVMPRSVHLLANPVIEVTGAVARAESDFVVIDRSGERGARPDRAGRSVPRRPAAGPRRSLAVRRADRGVDGAARRGRGDRRARRLTDPRPVSSGPPLSGSLGGVQILRDLVDKVPDGIECAISIGAYDGIHLGHQRVIAQLRARAAEHGLKTAIVTFDVHPAHVLRPESAPKLLTTFDQRLELLEAAGVDYLYVVHFTLGRSQTSPEEFVEQVFVNSLHTRAVVVGQDFHFGRGRSGDLSLLEAFGERYGFDVEGVELLTGPAGLTEHVSSTAIRRALAGGEVRRASEMLGRNYEIRGEVVQGEQRGRTIGFPTANIPVTTDMAWPADGVYAGWFIRNDGTRHCCAINIGRRPTFHQHAEHSLLEAHVLDFEGDLYGEVVRVEFVEFLRSEQRFNGIDALVAQLKVDIDAAREILGC